jgi:hypothetical protein
LGRPAVVPPAGRAWEWPRPCQGAEGSEGGALSKKAPRKVRPSVGTVCHRPVPGPLSGLPGGVGMARGT